MNFKSTACQERSHKRLVLYDSIICEIPEKKRSGGKRNDWKGAGESFLEWQKCSASWSCMYQTHWIIRLNMDTSIICKFYFNKTNFLKLCPADKLSQALKPTSTFKGCELSMDFQVISVFLIWMLKAFTF